MSTLTGRTIADSYTELLKTAAGGGITSSLTVVEDGDATASALQISTQGIQSSGSLVVVGQSSLAGVSASGNISTIANLSVDGNTTLGDNAALDTTEFKSRVASSLIPSSDDVNDLGSSSLEWKDLYVDGTANIDSLIADTADINGGTIDGTAIGASSASTGKFTQVNVEAQGAVRFEDTTGGQYVGFRAPGTIPASYTLTLPTATGSAGFVMVTDGSGNLSWQNPYGGGATSVISAADSSLAVVDAGSGTIIGSIDGSNVFQVTSTGLSVTGDLSVSGAINGTASTANTLTNSRNFSITGDVTAPAIAFNGSAAVALVSTLANGVVANANVGASAAIAFSKLASLTSGNLLVGNASDVATSVSLSGDATLSNTGALTIANNAITNAKVSASAAIDFSKLASLNSANILVGNSSNVATAVSVTGDVTISNAGATTIANNAVTTAKIADANVTATKVDKAGVAVLGTAQEYTRTHNFNCTTLTDGATINWDLSQNQVAKVTLGGNRTFAAPTNLVEGSTYILVLIQDGTGSRTITWNAAYKFAGGTAPTLTTTANRADVITFICIGSVLFGVSSLNFVTS